MRLKDQTPAELASTIRGLVFDRPTVDGKAMIVDLAIDQAAEAHYGQNRRTPTIMSDGTAMIGSQPYIIHPLRNALRIIRWGHNEAEIVAAAVLHDTVEDRPEWLANRLPENAKSEFTLTRHELQEHAFRYLGNTYGPRVCNIVRAVTNPLMPYGVPGMPGDAYAEHVASVLPLRFDSFIVKAADFVDNALSLHHHKDNPAMVRKLATKYLPLCQPFFEAMYQYSADGYMIHDDLREKLTSASGYLRLQLREASA